MKKINLQKEDELLMGVAKRKQENKLKKKIDIPGCMDSFLRSFTQDNIKSNQKK